MCGSRRADIRSGSRPAARTEDQIMRHRASARRIVSLSPTCLLTALAIGLAGCASAPPGGTTQAPAEQPLAVIDAHIHTSFTDAVPEPGNVLNSKRELAAEMKGYNVVGAVSMNHPGDPYSDLPGLNVIQCVGLPEKVDADKLEADLASRKYRCITIYLAYEREYASDPNYEPAYRLAAKYKVPIVFDTVDRDSRDTLFKSADPLTTAEVAADHRSVTFVLAHEGNSHTVDQRDRDKWLEKNTSPVVVWEFGDDPWIGPAAAVTRENPNVVLDGSAFLIGDLLAAGPEQIKTYLGDRVNWVFKHIGDPSKLMFGTAWPETEIGPYLEVFKRAIPKENRQAVFHDNAARVYGFDKPTAAK
jgi:predicted TIM-barrel fold metal-dependent hydrolase